MLNFYQYIYYIKYLHDFYYIILFYLWFKFLYSLQNIFHLSLLRFSSFFSFLFFLVSTPQTFFFLFILLILFHQLTTPKTLPSTLTVSFSILFLLSSPSYTLHTPTITTSPFHGSRWISFSTPFVLESLPPRHIFFDPERCWTCVRLRTRGYYLLLRFTTDTSGLLRAAA